MGPLVSRATARSRACFARSRLSACERRGSAGACPTGWCTRASACRRQSLPQQSLPRLPPHLPHLPLQGFIYHSLFQRAVDPAAWGHIRWTAALDPCVWNAQTGLARQCRPELCSGETRVYHHVESQLPALCGKSAAAAEPLDGAARQRSLPRSAAHDSSRRCAATPGCCARHPGACRTKEA